MEGKDSSKNLKAIEKPEERYKQALHPEEAGGTSISRSVLTPDLPKSDLYSIFSAEGGGGSNQCSGLSRFFEEKKEYNNASSCLSPYKATKLQEVIN